LTLVFEAPSISITSMLEPLDISRQLVQISQGEAVGPVSQLSAFAKIRAAEVFPHPLGPENK